MRTAAFLTLWLLLGFTAAAQPGAVVLEAVTDRKYYRENARSEIHVDARVTPAPAAARTSQKPAVRNIALVLDRSGSMAGEPLAELRRAVTGALELVAEDDFLAVVFFGSEVETLVESQPRSRIRDLDTRLAGLETVGGAALYDALNQGAAQLRRNAGPATIEQLILVTDGPPTKGPREVEDFARLAEAFGREGIQLSTIGLGPDFNEDMLAAMARTAQGNFRYAPKPAALAAALAAELRPRPILLGRDAVLTVEFVRATRMLRSYGWREPVLGERSLTFHIPRLLSTTLPSVLVSAEVESFDTRFDLSDFAKVQLTWKAIDSDQTHQLTHTIPAKFSTDSYDLREPLANHIARAGASAVARANLQKAIEALDKNDPRRAARQLRTLRSEVRDLNYDLDDRELNDLLRAIDAFLPQFQSAATTASSGYSSSASSSSSSMGSQRPATPATTGHDRKMLRSGMLGLFPPPSAPVEAKR